MAQSTGTCAQNVTAVYVRAGAQLRQGAPRRLGPSLPPSLLSSASGVAWPQDVCGFIPPGQLPDSCNPRPDGDCCWQRESHTSLSLSLKHTSQEVPGWGGSLAGSTGLSLSHLDRLGASQSASHHEPGLLQGGSGRAPSIRRESGDEEGCRVAGRSGVAAETQRENVQPRNAEPSRGQQGIWSGGARGVQATDYSLGSLLGGYGRKGTPILVTKLLSYLRIPQLAQLRCFLSFRHSVQVIHTLSCIKNTQHCEVGQRKKLRHSKINWHAQDSRAGARGVSWVLLPALSLSDHGQVLSFPWASVSPSPH